MSLVALQTPEPQYRGEQKIKRPKAMKILAIDDDPVILDLLELMIGEADAHELVTAASGAKALSLLSSQTGDSFDCFLVDIQMPEMDGIELCRRLRAKSEYLDTPVVMLTAMSEKRYIDAAFAAGATDYITKPFDATDLKARLFVMQNLIERRTAEADAATPAPGRQGDVGQELSGNELFFPVHLRGVENVIDIVALENYVTQLSRSKLFGSTAFAFAIRRVDELHRRLLPQEFVAMLTQVASMTARGLAPHQVLISYAGNGVFLCITERGWRPDTGQLRDKLNLELAQEVICSESGQRLQPRLVAGEAVRLVWKTDASLMEALSEAHASAEAASTNAEAVMGNIRHLDRYTA